MQPNPKDAVQNEAIKAWWAVGKGTIATCPGSGKTRIALYLANQIRAIYDKRLMSFSCLFLSYSTVGRDVNFPKELKKWGYSELEAVAENHCIQSVYKQRGKYWDVIVVDEIHNMTSPEYSAFLAGNTFKYKIGLSGTIKWDREQILNQLGFPVVYSLSLEEGMKKGVVSQFKVINVLIDLNEEQQAKYDNIARTMESNIRSLGCDTFSGLERAFEVMQNGPMELKKFAGVVIKKNAERTKFIDQHYDKVFAAVEIRKALINRKAIIFAANIDQCERIADLVDGVYVHSKNKKKKGNETSFFIFENDPFGTLVAVQQVNEVYDLKGISLGIVVSGKSSSKTSNQRAGRSVRPQENGQVSFVFNLVLKNTIEEVWLAIRNKSYSEETVVNVLNLEGALNYIQNYENNLRL
jgi:superfamily II DNA or RNA helicase